MPEKLPMPFQKWTTYPGHDGVDFPQPRNTLIRASGDGVVAAISYSKRGGWRVWIDYGLRGILKYCHMDTRQKIIVNHGDKVKYGTPIALVGSLGQKSTGPHLHLENAASVGFANVWRIVDKNSYVNQPATAVSSVAQPATAESSVNKMTPEQFAYLMAMNDKLDWSLAAITSLTEALRETSELTPGMNEKLDNIQSAAENLLKNG